MRYIYDLVINILLGAEYMNLKINIITLQSTIFITPWPQRPFVLKNDI